ncbi:TOMM precursor leader peptide-binding protein [Corynebacterium singulare]|uniref:TOMM leader peptide-binding protein n=1 Tax=Corynebacterium singulare TaxID=161899 RepID=A0ABS9PWN2_9CORY|nr:TOMM precursor leader peptide-binding protein [Corynebacterium singulare]MCG7276461.1 TOMM precursor leader peptide-binding protein [Corynebacterium singulare]
MAAQAYALAPDVAVLEREPGILQCGMDATRVGVLEAHPQLASLLNRLRTPLTRQTIEKSIENTGLTPAAARSVVDDLISYNVLWPEPTPQRVAVLGTSVLADELRDALLTDHFQPRSPLHTEPPAKYIEGVSGHLPIVAVDMLSGAVEWAHALHKSPATWLPVSMLDARGIIGPVRVKGTGPCPMCAHLHRIDADEQWHEVAQRASEASRPGDPVTRTAVVMHAVVTIRRLMGRPTPPGAPRTRPLAGELKEVDLYGVEQHRLVLEHPRCPYCRG